MYHLLRILLVGVGHNEARFDPLLIDFRDEQGLPRPESILWLSNTGGKTSILGLVYSLFHPHRRDFLGSKSLKQPRTLENYIQSNDVGHVVLEWGRPPEGAALPEMSAGLSRLVTGQVLSWNGDSLDRRFYSFEPDPDVLELDNLPLKREGGGRTPMDEYIKRLERLAAGVGNRIRLTVTHRQGEWQNHLANRGLDPEVFKYQLIMNEDEGGAGKFLDFKDGDSFVDFLLKLVADTRQAEKVGQNIAEVALQYAQRPNVQLELALCTGIDRLIPDLIAARDALAAARLRRDELRAEGRRLLSRVNASARAALSDQQNYEAEAERLRKEVAGLDEEIERWQSASLLLEEQVAIYRSQEAARALAEAKKLSKTTALDVSAWAIAADRLREREMKAEAKALREELARMEAGSVDLREGYEHAAARYRRRLDIQQSARRAEVDETERAHDAALTQVTEATDRAMEAAKRDAELKGLQRDLKGQLSRIEAEQADLVREGALRPGEPVALAQERVDDALEQLTARLAEIDRARQDLDTEQTDLRRRREARSTLLARIDTELSTLREKRESLVEKGRVLATAKEILEYGNGEAVDVFSQAPAILAHLARRAAEAREQLVSLGVDVNESERAYQFLQNRETLPPRRDVERAVALLERHGIWATSGWAYLPDNVAKELRPRLIEQRPEVVSGVVVNVGDVRKAMAVLKPAMVPDAPLVVAETSALKDIDDTKDGNAAWEVLPPSPAYYDANSAVAETARYALRLKEATAKREALTEFEARVAKLQSSLDALWDECRVKGLAQYDLEIGSRERQVGDLGHEIDGIDHRLKDIDLERKELERERKEREQRNARLQRHRTLLEGFATRSKSASSIQQRLDEIGRELKEVAEAFAAHNAAAKQAREAALDSERKLRELGLVLQEIDREIREVGDIGSSLRVDDDPSLGSEELARAFRTARQIYLLHTSGSQTALRLDIVQKELGSLGARLGANPPEVLARTDELLNGPDGQSLATRQAASLKATQADDEARRQEMACDLRAKEIAKELKDARERASGAGKLAPELLPSNLVEAQELLTQARKKFDEAREQKYSKSDQIKTLDAEARDAGNRNQMFSMLARTLMAALSGDVTEGESLEIEAEVIDVAEATGKVDQLQPAVQEAERAVTDRREDLRRRATRLRDLVREPRFAPIEGPVRERFLEPDDEMLADVASEKQGWLRELIAQIEAELKNIEDHRRLVALELLRLVKEALSLINAVQSGSELPDVQALHEWAHQQYLRIYYQHPNPEMLLPRLEAFVDNLIRAKVTRLDGEALLIDAVRSVVDFRDREHRQQFEVTVLKPLVGLPRVRASVSEISKWSGGQKLTTALLIYCVLVRLRVRNRGAGPEARRTVLLLDNPTGAANLVDLVDLQLTVAREFGVQLIIATGVNDYSAIAAYPHVIRLRNMKNRKGTNSFVQVQAAGTPEEVEGMTAAGIVSAVRVGRRVDELPKVEVV